MTERGQIQEILKQYGKHGWILRRVLLSAPTTESLSGEMFGNIEITKSDFDALWFSRPAANGGETWELRTISTAPFALVEVFTDEDEEAVRDEIRREMETQMAQKASKSVQQNTGH